jgi:hypothetical protein
LAGTRKTLFELGFQGYPEGSSPKWATRGPSAQSSVSAFIEGPLVKDFISYLSKLKAEKHIEAESHRRSAKVAENEPLEALKRRLSL